MLWKTIEEFPGYSVSRHGEVRNDKTGRLLSLNTNQQGIVQVGLMYNGTQYKRSVAVLVAEAFLPTPGLEAFDTPIHLNGDRTDCDYDNLMWRPRWFAVRYHQQFHNDKRGFDRPIKEIHSGEVFPNSWEAAIQYGLLDREIMIATLNNVYVFPTYQEFELLEE